jgi:hypothetical protein
MQFDSSLAAEQLRDRKLGKDFREMGNQIWERRFLERPEAD